MLDRKRVTAATEPHARGLHDQMRNRLPLSAIRVSGSPRRVARRGAEVSLDLFEPVARNTSV